MEHFYQFMDGLKMSNLDPKAYDEEKVENGIIRFQEIFKAKLTKKAVKEYNREHGI